MRAALNPTVLILASRYDLACDLVVSRLREYGTPYFRLNTEDMPQFSLSFDPLQRMVAGTSPALEFSISGDQLRAVFFRRPVFLRDNGGTVHTVDEQLARTQWAAFTRSFMVFDRCRWMNYPAATYKAENKPVQLATAAALGFEVPATLITNSADRAPAVADESGMVAVKGLDTVLLRQGDVETFGFTSLVHLDDVGRSTLTSAPAIVQRAIEPKVDLRVTVVDGEVFAVSVTSAGESIRGDWRLQKNSAEFRPYDLPQEIQGRCVQLVHRLGLTFGAIDLAVQGDRCFFLEINPTGEWAWLVHEAGLPIHDAIARYLGDVSQCQ